MRPVLVIISSEQFGYSPSTYYYCKYLVNRYDILYICWDHGLEKISLPKIRVKYVSRKGGLFRIVRITREILRATTTRNTIIFIKYFKIINSIIRILRSSSLIILDIRTGSIESSPTKRYIENTALKLETHLFDNITIISKSLGLKLGLDKKATILPLGADIISTKNKTFEEFNLLYVGTFYNRKLDVMLTGFSIFYHAFSQLTPIKLTIVGAEKNNEEILLRSMVEKYGLIDVVNISGRVSRNKLQKYFDTHNIGVSYIPMTDYYDVQPATKTFEYLLSGMPVIATSTSENRQVITPSNGVLTGDTARNFSEGLAKIFNNRRQFNSTMIRNNSLHYSWKNIVKGLDRYLEELTQVKKRL